MSARAPWALAASAVLLAAGCRQDMHDQPRFEPLERSAFFADGRSSRPQVPGTVARGELELDELLLTGMEGGEPAREFPFPVTAEVLARGRDRYDVFCAACHDSLGYGLSLAVERGVKRPPSLHEERLRAAPPGYLYGVITRGFGAMLDMGDQLSPRDRWAVVAHVRVLQRSQAATLDDVPPAERARLEGELK
jgi:mono/diheme cytochrome c family protein